LNPFLAAGTPTNGTAIDRLEAIRVVKNPDAALIEVG
jgi:hypothetical protein